jgi:hypothetical protein
LSVLVPRSEAKPTPFLLAPPQPVRLEDVKLLMAALKLLLVGYAADLLFSDLCVEFVSSLDASWRASR